MSRQLLMYVPVIHAGYQGFIERHLPADEILLIDGSFANRFPAMRKEIRALKAEDAAEYLRSRYRVPHIRTVPHHHLARSVWADELVIPDETIMRELAADLGLTDSSAGANVTKAVFDTTFLRWDRAWSPAGRPAGYDGLTVAGGTDAKRMGQAMMEAAKSSDWWRHVGAAVVAGNRIITAHNRHLPTEYSPYLDGDPRNDFSRGDRADLTTAIHAEASAIGQAAGQGVALRGADIYVTTFPCPGCAYLIAEAGFSRCFYAGGYSVMDGDNIMRAAGVELIFVIM